MRRRVERGNELRRGGVEREMVEPLLMSFRQYSLDNKVCKPSKRSRQAGAVDVGTGTGTGAGAGTGAGTGIGSSASQFSLFSPLLN
ncbi:hypothetical protein M0804_007071 [Polistes exclamans]|nr:hypothetical protein M0804_007071 [Polistes exclamans]